MFLGFFFVIEGVVKIAILILSSMFFVLHHRQRMNDKVIKLSVSVLVYIIELPKIIQDIMLIWVGRAQRLAPARPGVSRGCRCRQYLKSKP